MPIFCDNCGYQNRASAKFCQGCGGKIIATTPHGTLQTGVILNKNYEIKSLLKQGGMGAVYQAFNRKFDTICAVKELLSQTANSKDHQYMIDSFEREAKILHKLRHPNIPVVVDYFIEAGRYYLVMDYIEGKDLDTVMASYPGCMVPEDIVIEWAKEILNALDYLHSQNPPIIYRDIKPANIMLRSSDKKVILIDFGIARTITPGGQTLKTKIGTPEFAPKELFHGQPEVRSDIYSLGATMHCLLTGKAPLAPFDFKPVRDINPSISEGLEKVVMKSLSMDIDRRHKTAREMKEALLSLSSHAQTLNKPQPVIVQSQINQLNINYVKCPDCNTINIDGNVFCDDCGRSLIEPVKSPQINQIMTADKWNRKGLEYLNQNKCEEAIKCYDKALEIDSRYYKAWNNKGIALHKQGNIEESIKCYDKALQIAPEHKESLNNKKYALRSYGIASTTPPIKKSYIKPEMVYIEGGTFMMGSNNGSNNEKPVHKVTVNSFYIGKYAVTNKEYCKYDPSHKNSGDNLPVVFVGWDDALAYCKWLSEKTGNTYRLPTEAEWEFACRAGTTTNYYWGDNMNGDYCWYSKNSDWKVHPVCQKQPNAWGLYDMSGNVWEWCNDWYGDYPSDSVTNPTGLGIDSDRVLRGGSWSDYDRSCRSGNRFYFSFALRRDYYGFRLVRTR